MAFTQTQSDNFTRANESPLSNGGNWGAMTGLSQPNLISNEVQPPAINTPGVSTWTGASWPNDQYSEIIVHTLTGVNSNIYAICRGATGAITMYRAVFAGGSSVFIDKFVAGANTLLLNAVAPATINAGDALALSVVGKVLALFVNRVLVCATTDSSIASGNAGVGVYSAANAITSAQISAWNAGSATSSLASGNPVPVGANLAGGVTGTAYSETITGAGGTSPYTFAVTSGTLPTSLSLNTSSGVISGTPTVAGTYTFTITATDANSATGATAFQIIISAPAASGGGSYVFAG